MYARWTVGCQTAAQQRDPRAQRCGGTWQVRATPALASTRGHARRPAGASWKASPSDARASQRQQPSHLPLCCR
eukprot:11778928-Alexandrium_andersonii.AAC.2